MTTKKRKPLGSMFDIEPTKPEKITLKRPDREGKRATIMQINETAKRQLAILAIEQDKTQQEILTEGLNAVFKHYKKPAIA